MNAMLSFLDYMIGEPAEAPDDELEREPPPNAFVRGMSLALFISLIVWIAVALLAWRILIAL